VPIDVKCSHCEARFRVPDKFAGKRAKCPKCQGSIAIPAPKQPAAEAPAAEEAKAAEKAVTPQETPQQKAPQQKAPQKKAPEQKAPQQKAPQQKAPQQKAPQQKAPQQKAPQQKAPQQEAPQQKAPKKHPPAKKPPPEEWYLQTEDGEQFGPISREELDEWVAEGRVDTECQVLREGWDQWQWAEEVFPELSELVEEPQPVEAFAPPPMPVAEENPFAVIAGSPAAVGTRTPSIMPGAASTSQSGAAIPSGVSISLSKTNGSIMLAAIAGIAGCGLWVAECIMEMVNVINILKEISKAKNIVGASDGLSDVQTFATVGLISVIFTLLAALFYMACSALLLNYSLRIGVFTRRKEERELLGALSAHRTFWQVVAFGTAVIVGVSLIFFILLLVLKPDVQSLFG